MPTRVTRTQKANKIFLQAIQYRKDECYRSSFLLPAIITCWFQNNIEFFHFAIPLISLPYFNSKNKMPMINFCLKTPLPPFYTILIRTKLLNNY